MQYPAFLWGCGAAIGELPPYFIARAGESGITAGSRPWLRAVAFVPQTTGAALPARFSQEDPDDEDLEEFHEALRDDSTNLLARAKVRVFPTHTAGPFSFLASLSLYLGWVGCGRVVRRAWTPCAWVQRAMHQLVQRAGFWGIFICAAIPNPLFDLAGITCGHFMVYSGWWLVDFCVGRIEHDGPGPSRRAQIPFYVFFGATFLGKAVFKLHIQMFLLVFFMSKPMFEAMLKRIRTMPAVGKCWRRFPVANAVRWDSGGHRHCVTVSRRMAP